jgi:hypothetical protein
LISARSVNEFFFVSIYKNWNESTYSNNGHSTILTLAVQNSQSVGYAQTAPAKEKDVFKVIVTLFGVKLTTGNIVSFVTVDNMSMVKVFDAAKYYIPVEDTETRAATMAYGNTTISSSSAKDNAGNGGLLRFPQRYNKKRS